MSENEKAQLLSEAFSTFLKFGLKPDQAVRALFVDMHFRKLVLNASVPQEFKSYFPNLPEPVSEALFDLYRQVLLHVEINSKVRI